jgi:hypothetical protein
LRERQRGAAFDTTGERIEHVASADRHDWRLAAQHERLSPGSDRRLCEQQLDQTSSAGFQPVGFQQHDAGDQFGRSQVTSHASAVLQRMSRGPEQAYLRGQRFTRDQIARRRQLLAAPDFVMAYAGQIDGGPLTAVHFLDGLVVVLQPADANRN